MFVDASALTAIIANEPDGPALLIALRRTDRRYTSAVAVYEAVLALARIGNTAVALSRAVVQQFLGEFSVELIPITAEIGTLAIAAFERFGRPHHPARLNMGDCFAYACARTLQVPLLFKGEDFRHPDIAAGLRR